MNCLKTILLTLFFSSLSFSNTAAKDSLAYAKFISAITRQNDSINSYHGVMKTRTEVTMDVEGNSNKMVDSSVCRLWTLFPDKNRTEMKSKKMSFTTVTNGSRTVFINDSTGKKSKFDNPSIGAAMSAAPLNARKLIDNFKEKPSFVLQKGDSTAIMEGEFSYQGKTSWSKMTCDLKRNRITEIAMSGAFLKFEYRKIGIIDCIEQVTMSAGNSGTAINVHMRFDTLKINETIDQSIFLIEETE